MLDTNVIELADRLIRIQFHERTKQLEKDILLVQNDAAMRGLGTSSTVVDEVYSLCARDIELRALIVWQALLRVLLQAKIASSASLDEDLKQAVSSYESAIYTFTDGRLQEVSRNTGFVSRQSLTVAREHALAKVHAEIDLFVLGLTRRESQGETSAPLHLNITGNVGAVMTGPNANASISQVIGEQERHALMKVLDMVQSQLERLDRLPAYPKEEIIELLVEARAEAEKPRPNGTKLRSALIDISTAIQTVGSLNDCYQLLKTTLIPFGIHLP